MQKWLTDLYKESVTKEFSSFDITKYIGSRLNETSFLYWASKNNIPVIVPGIVDGAVGSQIWLFYQNHKDFRAESPE